MTLKLDCDRSAHVQEYAVAFFMLPPENLSLQDFWHCAIVSGCTLHIPTVKQRKTTSPRLKTVFGITE